MKVMNVPYDNPISFVYFSSHLPDRNCARKGLMQLPESKFPDLMCEGDYERECI